MNRCGADRAWLMSRVQCFAYSHQFVYSGFRIALNAKQSRLLTRKLAMLATLHTTRLSGIKIVRFGDLSIGRVMLTIVALSPLRAVLAPPVRVFRPSLVSPAVHRNRLHSRVPSFNTVSWD
jgi:hypothetical protein